MLDAPRELVVWALALLDDPPNALVFLDALLLGTCRFPILFPPPLLRFAPLLLARESPLEPARFPVPPARLLAPGCCLPAPPRSIVPACWRPPS